MWGYFILANTGEGVAKGHTAVTDADVAMTYTTARKTEGRRCLVYNVELKVSQEFTMLGRVYVKKQV